MPNCNGSGSTVDIGCGTRIVGLFPRYSLMWIAWCLTSHILLLPARE